ncbi:hypothetical protein PQR37_39535 [Paraburkholderia nemoris]
MNDADQVLVPTIEDGQTVNMTLTHDPFDVFGRIILEAGKDLGRHRLTHGHPADVAGIRDAPAWGYRGR